jgi:transposase-like protein
MNNDDSQRPMDPRRRSAALLLSKGWTQKRVAEELEITEQTLCKWRREPLVEALIVDFSIEREQKEMERFSVLMNAAYSRLAKIVESDDDKVALAAIKIVIDAKDQLFSTTVAPNHDAPTPTDTPAAKDPFSI